MRAERACLGLARGGGARHPGTIEGWEMEAWGWHMIVDNVAEYAWGYLMVPIFLRVLVRCCPLAAMIPLMGNAFRH